MRFRHLLSSSAVLSLSFAAAALLGTGALNAQTYNNTIFGKNVYVLDPSIGTAGLNAQLNALNGEAQFSGNRYTILFKPGTYTLSSEVGYYEEIAGLGQTPGAVVLNGGGVYTDLYVSGNLTQNFWRSVANYTVNPPTDPNSNPVTNTNRWGVSQGASFRRIHVGGYLELTDQSCAICERRLHQRLSHRSAPRRLLAAAVVHPQQRHRPVDRRCLELRLLRRPGRARADLPQPPHHHPRLHAGQPRKALPLPRR